MGLDGRRLAAFVAAACIVVSAWAGAPEGFTVMGDRVRDFPPPKGFAEAPPIGNSVPQQLTEADKTFGGLIYSRCPSLSVRRRSAPDLHEVTDGVATFATPGEYEPWTFSLYALRALKAVRAVAAPLRGPNGAVIPLDHLDLRVLGYVWRRGSGATYSWRPGFLEHRDRVDVPAGESRRFWLTVKVPDDAAAGLYEGAVTLHAGGRTRRVVVRLRVLPFKLDKAPYMGSMLTPSFQMYGDVFGKELLHEKMVDLREHGHGDAFGYFTFVPAFRGGPADDPQLDFDTPSGRSYYSCNQIVAAMRKAGVWGPIYANRCGAALAGYAGRYGKQFEAAFAAMVRKMHDHARRNDWPPLYIGYGDEPSHGTDMLQRCRHFFRIIHAGGGSPTSYLNGGWRGIDSASMFWPYQKVVHTNYFDPEMLKRMRQRRQRLWLYNVGLGRFEHGWQCIASGTELVTQYDYQTWSAPDRGAFKYCAAAGDAASKKPIPSEGYENAREGMDDARYYATLLNDIGRARLTRQDDALRAAQEAEKMLDAWLARIPPERRVLRNWRTKLGLSGRDLHKVRWRMARHILAIRERIKPFENEPWYK